MWVQSLGWEDPLEQGMATHSSILAWRIPGTGHVPCIARQILNQWTAREVPEFFF